MDFERMRVLYYDSTIIVKNDIIWGLLELGIDVVRGKIRTNLIETSDEEIETIKGELDGYDFVITQNFGVNVAEACHQKNKPYISWIYDSPYIATYQKEALYPTNFIFAFDKKQVERIKAIGCKNIFYQPLAANMAITSMLNISDEDIAKYQTDVAFVGKIYEHSFYEKFISVASENVKKDIDDMFENVACHWGKEITPFGYLSDETINFIDSFMDQSYKGKYKIDKRFLNEAVLMIPTIAGYERKKTLKLCGDNFKTALYTTSNLDVLKQIDELNKISIYPPVNYDDEMYKVFYSSKINLNLTLRSIETGIPQRIFDIMSVGGPVFTNYQEEIEELFVPGKDIVVFNSLEELKDKADYYLRHENERVRLGINGYYRVRDEYNYTESLKKMFAIVEK